MVIIDCAYDTNLAEELDKYLKDHGLQTKIEKSSLIVEKQDLEKILKLFLAETERSDYKIRRIDSETFLVAREVPIEEFGFFRCEMCGYVVSSEEELLVHRRSHGIQLL